MFDLGRVTRGFGKKTPPIFQKVAQKVSKRKSQNIYDQAETEIPKYLQHTLLLKS
jgi:hypothetical protein